MPTAAEPHARRVVAASGFAALVLGVGVALGRRRRRRLPKSFVLERVLRPCVWRAESYHFPPRFGQSGDVGKLVLLDANENAFGPPIKEVAIDALTLERYPDPRQDELRQALASLRGCRPEQVVVGVGSDEIIDLLIRVACTPGSDAIMVCSPTYAMYATFAGVNDVGVVDVPLTADNEFQLRIDAMKAAMTPRVKIVFLCSPGNPTGRLLRRADIEGIAELATNAIVVVDEAYIDFALESGGSDVSCVPFVASGKYPNVVVSQTLSKAWGLAGARVGVAFAQEELISVISKVKGPFNVSTLAEDVAKRALSQADAVRVNVRKVLAERARVIDMISRAPFFGPGAVQQVYASDANFLLVRIANAKDVCEIMARDSNVIVRFRGNMLNCKDCVRISIGTCAENDRCLKALLDAVRARDTAFAS